MAIFEYIKIAGAAFGLFIAWLLLTAVTVTYILIWPAAIVYAAYLIANAIGAK